MLRHIFLFLVVSSSAFAEWDEDDEYAEYREIPNRISYAGMSIDCYWGCGEFEEDPSMDVIVSTLESTVNTIYSPYSPLDVAYDPLNYPFDSWSFEGSECRAYNWRKTKGFYLPDHPEETYSLASYPKFLKVASALRRDARFYLLDVHLKELNLYKSVLPKLKKELAKGIYGNVRFNQNGELEFFGWGTYTGRVQPIDEFIQFLNKKIDELERDLPSFHLEQYEARSESLEKAIQEVYKIYNDILGWCLKNHQPEGIAFHAALEEFIKGDFDKAINQVQRLLKIAKDQTLGKKLVAKLHLLKGQIQSEFGLYADAVISLTAAIKKNPKMENAYFERAVAYFELGQFDKAVEDFASSSKRPQFQNSSYLGFGIGAGVIEGAGVSLIEFVPSTLGTLRGLGNGLWAFSKHPVSASQDLVDAAIKCVEYLKTTSTEEIIQEMVPEFKELMQKYDDLGDFEKGKLIGTIIGKYGVDIFCAKYATKAVKAYRELKKANQVMTLEALATPERTQTILSEAGKRWAVREEMIKRGNVKIHEGRQGKHMEHHINYKDLKKRNELPSIFEHPNPQKLIHDYAGTGIKSRGNIPGAPGYTELVNFDEFIGYALNLKTGEKTATTWGKIHYSKDGVHIVPTVPRSP